MATIDYTKMPDERGHFGIYGGRFVSETLMEALEELQMTKISRHNLMQTLPIT